MGALSNIRKTVSDTALKIALWSNQKSVSNTVWNHPSFGDFNSASNKFTNEKAQMSAYTQIAWAAIAVDHLMNDAGNRDWYFAKKNGNKLEEIDIKKVDERIKTPFMNGYAKKSFSKLMGPVVGQRALTGNALFLKMEKTLYGRVYKVKELFVPIKPGNFKPLISDDGLVLKGYEITLDDSRRFDVKPEDVIHFSQNNLYSPFVGVGTIEKARIMYETEVRKENFQNEFFRRGASPSMLITDGQDRNPEDIIRINAMLEEKYSGEKNAGRLMYLSGKDMDAKQMGISNKDLQFLEEKEFNRQTTLSLFGVPPTIAGIPGDSNRALSDNDRLNYLENTINPIIKDLEDTINTQHVHLIDPTIYFVFRKHLTGDVDKAIKMYQGGLITGNRASEMVGEEFDTTDDDRNQYILPMGFGPIGLEIETPPENTEPNETTSPKKSKSKSIDQICDDFEKSATRPRKFQAKYLKAALKGREQTAEKYTPSLEDFFKKQRNRVLKSFIENESKIKQIMEHSKGAKSLDDNILEIIFDISGEDNKIRDEIKKLHTSAVQKSVANVNEIAGSTVNVALTNPAIANLINRLGKQIVDGYDLEGNRISLNETTRKLIAKAIINSIQDGATIEEMQTALLEQFDKFTNYRARTIARTESRIAYDQGSLIAFKDLDVKTIDVVGCENFEPDSDCGRQNVPIDQQLNFHPNHIGVVVPHIEP